MAQAVMQIGQGWFQGNRGAVLIDGFSIISFCRFKVAHQLMQAIRAWVCLVESKISRGCQFFVATRAPVGCLSRIPIGRRQSLQSLESSLILSRVQQCARHSKAKFSGGPRGEYRPHAWSDLRKLPAQEREVDVCFGAVPAGNVLPGGGSCKGSLGRCLREVPVLFGEKRKSQVRCWRIPILQFSREFLNFFAGSAGKLFEGGIAESFLPKAQEPFRLLHLDGQRFPPILKRGLHIFVEQTCFTSTHQGTQVSRVMPQLLIKFPN